MKLLLQRFSDNRTSTLGLLFKESILSNGSKWSFFCYTLEDEYREVKVKGETRIPSGTYKLAIQKAETPLTLRYRTKYTWFKHHIEITKVPNFQGVYIHIGNTDVDTDGCILLGDAADNNQIQSGTISASTQAFLRFYNTVYDLLDQGKEVTLEIRDENKLL